MDTDRKPLFSFLMSLWKQSAFKVKLHVIVLKWNLLGLLIDFLQLFPLQETLIHIFIHFIFSHSDQQHQGKLSYISRRIMWTSSQCFHRLFFWFWKNVSEFILTLWFQTASKYSGNAIFLHFIHYSFIINQIKQWVVDWLIHNNLIGL